MDIVIRKASAIDAPVLAAILSGTKNYKDDANDNKERCVIVTNTYIEKNTVFVAEEKEEIIACCAIHEVKQAIRTKAQVIETGYWLEQFFISPTCHEKMMIANRLMTQIKEYCMVHQIAELKVLSDKEMRTFYINMGAISIDGGDILSFPINQAIEKISLAQKLDMLDEDAEEDARYAEEEALYELEHQGAFCLEDYLETDERLYNEESAFTSSEDSLEEEQEIICKKELFKPVMHIKAENQVESVDNEAKDKTLSRLSYEECQKSVVPISYKFENEELNELNYEKVLKAQEQEEYKVKEAIYGHRETSYENIMAEEETEKKLYQLAYIKIKKWFNEEKLDTMSENKHFDKQRAKILLRDFNALDDEDTDKAYELLEKLFGKLGEDIHIEPYFKCSYGYNIEIGDNFYADVNCVIDDHALVKIGNHCILSPQVGIYTLAYPLNHKKRKEGHEYARPVTIGNNVWIGGGATVYPGVTIGNNVVVSPGAVVINDIPDDVLVAGNPAQIIN